MAYDPYLADRIRGCFKRFKVTYVEKPMMGGLCFLVDDKMCLGTHIDKKSTQNLLMLRIGSEQVSSHLSRPEAMPMDFTGRPMKDYLFVNENGFDLEEDLEYWLRLALDFNPEAKASKKKR